MSAHKCSNCERCTWNKGPDCGLAEHPHCERCGHCLGRHYSNRSWVWDRMHSQYVDALTIHHTLPQ